MCNGLRGKGAMYLWVGDITKKELKICRKCTLRELGSKNSKQKIKEIDDGKET